MVFNYEKSSPLQVIFYCMDSLHTWSIFHRTEYQPLFKVVCTQLEWMAMEVFPNMNGIITSVLVHHLFEIGIVTVLFDFTSADMSVF